MFSRLPLVRLFPCLLLITLSACQSGPPPAPDRAGADAPNTRQGSPSSTAPVWKTYGAQISKGTVVSLQSILASPAKIEGKQVIVEETVRQVCSRKGCCMEIGDTGSAAQGCRITFKDYAFFVPKTSKGATARAQGVIKTKLLSANEVKHMESERGRFRNKLPDGSAREVRLVASAVALRGSAQTESP